MQRSVEPATAYFEKLGLAGKTLFLAQANTISPRDTTVNLHYNSILEFNAIVGTYSQSGIRYAYKYFPDDDHGSVPMIAEYDALRFIFDGYHVNLLMALDDPSYLARHFAKMSKLLGTKLLPPESMVDQIASAEMTRDTTKAIALFRTNTELYPTSPNAFDQLGDALRAKGDRSGALVAYERALALDRGDKHATEQATQLRAVVRPR